MDRLFFFFFALWDQYVQVKDDVYLIVGKEKSAQVQAILKFILVRYHAQTYAKNETMDLIEILDPELFLAIAKFYMRVYPTKKFILHDEVPQLVYHYRREFGYRRSVKFLGDQHKAYLIYLALICLEKGAFVVPVEEWDDESGQMSSTPKNPCGEGDVPEKGSEEPECQNACDDSCDHCKTEEEAVVA